MREFSNLLCIPLNRPAFQLSDSASIEFSSSYIGQ